MSRITQDVVASSYPKADAAFDFLKGEPVSHINTGFPNAISAFDPFDAERRMSKVRRNEELKLVFEPFSDLPWKRFARSVESRRADNIHLSSSSRNAFTLFETLTRPFRKSC